IATPIGTATNVVALGFMRRPEVLGQSIDFLAWCLLGVPMMAIIFVGMYGWLRLQAPAEGLDMPALREYLRSEYDKLGRWKIGEVNTLAVFLVVVTLWVTPGVLALPITQRLVGTEALTNFNRCLPEAITALLAPVLLFLLPTDLRRRQFTLEPGDWQK